MRILVADDSSTVRKQVGKILTDAGHDCHYAEDGLEAIKLVLRTAYDAIITDLTMPVLDGLKFVQRIRASEKGKDVPILILSARSDIDAILKARDLGIQGYVVKPVVPQILLDHLRQATGTGPPEP